MLNFFIYYPGTAKELWGCSELISVRGQALPKWAYFDKAPQFIPFCTDAQAFSGPW